MKIQYPPFIYLLPCRFRKSADIKAAIDLVRETYEVVQSGIAPFSLGFLYQTSAPIKGVDMEVIGLVPWE